MKVKTRAIENRDPLMEYKNSGYGQNAFGWYFNPYTDEYDKDYDPTKDPLFGGKTDQEIAMENYYNSGYGKNAFDWYFNPNIDEYDKDYNPANDSLFNIKASTSANNKNTKKAATIVVENNKEAQEEKIVISNTQVINKQNEEISNKTSNNVPVFDGNDIEEDVHENEKEAYNTSDIPFEEITPIIDDIKEEEKLTEQNKSKDKTDKQDDDVIAVIPFDRNFRNNETNHRREHNPYEERKAATMTEENPTPTIVETIDEKPAKKPGLLKRVVARITLFALGIAAGLGLYHCKDHISKAGQIVRSNLETKNPFGNEQDNDTIQLANGDNLTLVDGQNAIYEAAPTVIPVAGTETKKGTEQVVASEKTNDTFAELLAKTTNEAQRKAMSTIGSYLTTYNTKFANHFAENVPIRDENGNITEYVTVKPALTWDEVTALHLAYNDYSRDEIRAIFNGSELDAQKLENDYKNATLQLMGAYVIEDRENQVDSRLLVNSEEGRAFVEKYNNLFLRCKETTGQEQIDAVNALYQEVYKDFPISDDVREVGLSHAEGREEIESYKIMI